MNIESAGYFFTNADIFFLLFYYWLVGTDDIPASLETFVS